jgi:hypothetical protein
VLTFSVHAGGRCIHQRIMSCQNPACRTEPLYFADEIPPHPVPSFIVPIAIAAITAGCFASDRFAGSKHNQESLRKIGQAIRATLSP